MAYIPDQLQNTGLFIQQTPIFDIQRLRETDINSDDFRNLLVSLAQQTNNISIALNLKETGYYLTQEFNTSGQFYNPNSSSPLDLIPKFRQAFNIGALPAGVTNYAHGLTIGTTWKFVDIYGTANDSVGSNYYPLPFSSAGGAANIELRVNATNIVITNNSGVVFDSCNVILEYIKV